MGREMSKARSWRHSLSKAVNTPLAQPSGFGEGKQLEGDMRKSVTVLEVVVDSGACCRC